MVPHLGVPLSERDMEMGTRLPGEPGSGPGCEKGIVTPANSAAKLRGLLLLDQGPDTDARFFFQQG